MKQNKTPSDICKHILNFNYLQSNLLENKFYGPILKRICKIPFDEILMEDYFLAGREDELLNKKTKEYETPSAKPQQKALYIARNLIMTARECNSDFFVLNGLPYFYTGKYWESVPPNYLTEFITVVAVKSGLLVSEANQAGFKKTLYEQLISDSCTTEIDKKSNNMKICINLQNGTLEYEDGQFNLREHRKNDRLTYILDYEYQPEAKCPKFDAFLDEVLPDKSAQDFLMEFIGFCFIPNSLLKLEVCLLLYGLGANGKGVIYEIVKDLIGAKQITGFNVSLLTTNLNSRAQISDALLNYSSELGGKCNGDMFKKLVSGEDVEAKLLYNDIFTLKDYNCKFMFNCNSLPKGSDIDEALSRRLAIMEFPNFIPEEKRDVTLHHKLKAELPGIFNRVIKGASRLLRNKHFTNVPSMNKMNELFKEKIDTVRQFIVDMDYVPSCDLKNVERLGCEISHLPLKEMFEEYKKYCQDANTTATNQRTFAERIRKYFYVQTRCSGNSTWVFAKRVIDLTPNPLDKKNEESESKPL